MKITMPSDAQACFDAALALARLGPATATDVPVLQRALHDEDLTLFCQDESLPLMPV